MERPLFIRADASAELGAGHIMRMLALAQAWRGEGGAAVFLCALLPDLLAERLRAEGFTVVRLPPTATQSADAQATLAAIEHQLSVFKFPVSGLKFQVSDAWLLADGYHFGPEFQQVIKAGGVRLLVVDDNGENSDYVCELVLNQNLHAAESFYARRTAQTRLLLGSRYALLRSEFLAARKQARVIPPIAHRLLVTLGGSDPGNMTGQVLASLAALGQMEGELVVVLGGGNPRGAELEHAAQALPWTTVRVLRNVSDMSSLLQQADLAVTAGGSTCWEMCLLGLPMLVISIAENQRQLALGLGAAGAACVVGHAGEFDPAALGRQLSNLWGDAVRRQALSTAARRIVDGLGAQRVLAALRGEELFLRPAAMEDAELLWNWANEPTIRAASFHPQPIPWETHLAWMQRKLGDERVMLLMAEAGEGPVGVVRFEREADGSAVISVALAAAARGRGLGAKLVAAGTRRFVATTDGRVIHAYIKPDNAASVSAFERAGFGVADDVNMAGAPALHRVWRSS